MNVINTEKYRNEIYDFIKSYLSESEVNWVLNVFSEINKHSMLAHDDEFDFKTYYFYKNLKRFLTNYVTDLDGGAILMTIYICAIQLGIKKVNDPVIATFKSVYDFYDLEDFERCTVNDLNLYDVRTMLIITRFHYEEFGEDIYSCGLLTLYAIEYI